jgi:hypothetical protein
LSKLEKVCLSNQNQARHFLNSFGMMVILEILFQVETMLQSDAAPIDSPKGCNRRSSRFLFRRLSNAYLGSIVPLSEPGLLTIILNWVKTSSFQLPLFH